MGGDVALSCHISANRTVTSRVGMYLGFGGDRNTEQRRPSVTWFTGM